MNSSQIKALVRAGKDIRKSVGDGLYFRIENGTASWVVRYTYARKRKTITLPEGYPHCSLAEAKIQAAAIRSKVKSGVDPQLEKKRKERGTIHTLDDLFEDWYERSVKKTIDHPENYERIYRLHIRPVLGKYSIYDIEPIDIREAFEKAANGTSKTTPFRCLLTLKRIFQHSLKLGLLTFNPAAAFVPKDIGKEPVARERNLSPEEIEIAFRLFRQHNDIVTRDNYLAFVLLLHIGCRKAELTSSRWEQVDIANQTWYFPHTKTKVPYTAPIPNQMIPLIEELKYRSAGSEYVFPARRKSKRRGYISDDTLNHALAKLFGKKVDSKKRPYPNIMGEHGIEHFTVHDFRRTYRTLLAELGVLDHVAERCINHRSKRNEATYNKYDYATECRKATAKVADFLEPLLQGGNDE